MCTSILNQNQILLFHMDLDMWSLCLLHVVFIVHCFHRILISSYALASCTLYRRRHIHTLSLGHQVQLFTHCSSHSPPSSQYFPHQTLPCNRHYWSQILLFLYITHCNRQVLPIISCLGIILSSESTSPGSQMHNIPLLHHELITTTYDRTLRYAPWMLIMVTYSNFGTDHECFEL